MEKFNRIDFRDQITSNKRKSIFLMLIVFAILVLFGYVISFAFDPGFFFTIMIISIIFSLGYVWISFYNSGKIAVSSVGAHIASRKEFKEYYDLVEALTLASGLPMPKLYIMNSEQINAFASGRDPQNAVVCVTKGALQKLDRHELEAVLAHELGHIANYDIRYITLVTVMVGMIAIVSQMFLRSLWFRSGDNDGKKGIFLIIGIVMAILAPIVVQLVQLSISRKREFSADATAVKFTRYPRGLINALEKIKKDVMQPEKKVSKAVAPLFFSNPFKGLGSTHPPLEKRIEVLKRM
ncbi:M48 family metallopeptidase [Nanoarchaeota archaeon]